MGKKIDEDERSMRAEMDELEDRKAQTAALSEEMAGVLRSLDLFIYGADLHVLIFELPNGKDMLTRLDEITKKLRVIDGEVWT